MTASNSVWGKNILAVVLALSASVACSQEIQTDADAVLSEAVSDSSGSGDTAKKALPSNEDQLPADIVSFFDRRWADRLLPAALTFGVMSLAPALLLMTTCFVRMSVVLSLTRQAIGTVNLPSTQIITSLALFLSALVMWPIWTTAYQAGLEPYQAGEISLQEAFERGSLPVRRWMAYQIEEAGNRDTVALFLQRHPGGVSQVDSYDQIPTEVLLPAFLVSELEVAFMIGFRILLPFLVLDCVVATLVVSTGLVMLPPTIVSLPLKLLVFVMADGWSLVVRGLLDGVRLNTS
jgi:flagellar biosynthetic protein FliP